VISVFVGNDVVDLATPRTQGRASDVRFLARVFNADEREAIRAGRGSDVELWSRWAAKEAGYKSISKAMGVRPFFLHKTFEVEWSAVTAEGDASARDHDALVRVGTVRHADRMADVSVRRRGDALHAVAVCGSAADVPECVATHLRFERLADADGCWSGSFEQLMRRLSAREADSVRSLESAAVRLGARRDLARILGVAEERVEIVCASGPATRRPPHVLVDGCHVAADLSLSHDGAWIAWAICLARSIPR
jgi:phosphopantetheinyl transferase (holo-ACP synthase)